MPHNKTIHTDKFKTRRHSKKKAYRLMDKIRINSTNQYYWDMHKS